MSLTIAAAVHKTTMPANKQLKENPASAKPDIGRYSREFPGCRVDEISDIKTPAPVLDQDAFLWYVPRLELV
jgi:hypothetical protein